MTVRKYIKGSVTERLAAHSARDGSGCVVWTGAKNSKGYGQLNISGQRKYAHRLAYEAAHGPIPEGAFVMHACDTPACINPEHLSAGTPAENMADKVRKGRQQRGQAVRNSVLTPAQVEAIRRDGRIQRDIALEFGVSRATVNDIKRGRTWRST